MGDLSIERLQGFSRRNFGVDWPAGLRLASALPGDPNGITKQLYNSDLNGAGEQLFTLMGARGLVLNNSANSWIDTPDHASLDIVGDIDIRLELEWAGGTGANQPLISKHGGAANTSFEWRIDFVANHQFFWSADGTNLLPTITMTPPGGFGVGQRMMLRLTMDVDNGASGRTIRYYSSLGNNIDTGPWTQVDEDIVSGITSIFASAILLRLGNRSTGGSGFNGKLFRAQIRNGIDGTVVANPDMRFLAPGTSSFVDSTGKTWTLGSGAVIA